LLASQIYICGHSAGAHLVSLLLVKNATFAVLGKDHIGDSYKNISDHFKDKIDYKAAILMSGVYDIAEHYLWESMRGKY
jgi:hypothetical protein